MLTIITGVPGSGKTLFTLSLVRKETRPEKGQTRRPILFHNVSDVDYQYFHANSLQDPDTWYNSPDGSLIVFDEAQYVFPQRKKDDKPKKVEEFSVHRHKGFDIFIVTQDPMNVDVFIRRMCGRHFHVQRILGRERSTVYEYDHYQADPTGYHEKKQAISKIPFKFPKDLYQRYKSATVHTVKKRTPLRLILLPLLLVFVIFLIVYAIHRIKNRADHLEEQATPSQAAGTVSNVTRGAGAAPGVTPMEYFISMYKPVMPGVLHTAPIYQGLIEPQTYPKPLCILYQENPWDKPDGSCKCVTQQHTVYETTEQNCRYWAIYGFFDESLSGDRGREEARGQAQAPSASSRY